jgi:pantoate--beta-alanine ligase
MKIIRTVAELRAATEVAGRIALVPTMGNLHAGHLSLVQQARQHADCVVTSIFVNPLQFGPNEDYASYPRTFEVDCQKLEAAGCDIVFAPTVDALYPVPQQVTVNPPPIANDLCGAFRPGHFAGVLTVVLKLMNIVQPDVAVFGKKDYQQLFIIRAMVEQLNVPVQIIGAEIVRAGDALALSSRNSYLSDPERMAAVQLNRALQGVRDGLAAGRREFAALEQAAQQALAAAGWKVDYVTVREAATLAPATADTRYFVILGAAWLGRTRLIDNIEYAA